MAGVRSTVSPTEEREIHGMMTDKLEQITEGIDEIKSDVDRMLDEFKDECNEILQGDSDVASARDIEDFKWALDNEIRVGNFPAAVVACPSTRVVDLIEMVEYEYNKGKPLGEAWLSALTFHRIL